MLREETRRKIIEHNWLEIERFESNPSQTWKRIRKESLQAIDDLILLAEKLPDDKQREIFIPDKIEKLIQITLSIGPVPYTDIFNPRKAELASRLVKIGVGLNSYQYRHLNRDTPSLVGPTTDHLERAVSICNDISYKLQLMKMREQEEKTGITYLFSWNKMLNREKHRLLEFIENHETGEHLKLEIFENSIKLTNDDKKVKFKYGLKVGEEIGEVVYGTVTISMNDTKSNAEITILDHNQIIHRENLLVTKSEEHNTDYNLFRKMNKLNRNKIKK